MKHRIRHKTLKDPFTKRSLYWSGEEGWGSRELADLFTTQELDSVNLPNTELETVCSVEFTEAEFRTVLAALQAWRASGSSEIAMELYQYHSKTEQAATPSTSRYAVATDNWKQPPLLPDQVTALVHRLTEQNQV